MWHHILGKSAFNVLTARTCLDHLTSWSMIVTSSAADRSTLEYCYNVRHGKTRMGWPAVKKSPSVWPHKPATGFRPPSTTVVSAEPFSHRTGTLRCLQKEWRLTDTDLCPCGETQTMSHVVESRLLTKLNGGLSRLHSADEDGVSWLTSYGSWHAYEKNKKVKNFEDMLIHFNRIHARDRQTDWWTDTTQRHTQQS